MKTRLLLILCGLCLSSFAQEYHVAEAYLMQEIEFRSQCSLGYKCNLGFPFFFGYYVADEKTLMNFFKADSVDLSKTVLLCDVHYDYAFVSDDYSVETRYFTSIREIVNLDDNEIYKIGSRGFIIRKIRYAFYENSEKQVYTRGYNIWYWDDVQDEDIPIRNAYHEVGETFERKYYQCIHHIEATLPTPIKIKKRMWKHAYQFTEECIKDSYRPLPYEW